MVGLWYAPGACSDQSYVPRGVWSASGIAWRSQWPVEWVKAGNPSLKAPGAGLAATWWWSLLVVEAPTVEVGALPWATLIVEVVPVGGVMVAPEAIPWVHCSIQSNPPVGWTHSAHIHLLWGILAVFASWLPCGPLQMLQEGHHGYHHRSNETLGHRAIIRDAKSRYNSNPIRSGHVDQDLLRYSLFLPWLLVEEGESIRENKPEGQPPLYPQFPLSPAALKPWRQWHIFSPQSSTQAPLAIQGQCKFSFGLASWMNAHLQQRYRLIKNHFSCCEATHKENHREASQIKTLITKSPRFAFGESLSLLDLPILLYYPTNNLTTNCI